MALKAVEYTFTGSTTPYTSYDSTKINLGKWIQQKTGTGVYDNFVGPFPLAFGRPLEQSTAIASNVLFVYDWSSSVSWIFMAENSVGVTRRIVLYKFDKTTQELSWRGFITLTYPTATFHTIKGMVVGYHKYTTGTVAVSGTAVTGSSTAWTTAGYAVGARIGFGSTDPTAITTWYHISAIGSNTSITLTENAGTISDGPFVIEELRVYTATTNATAANGGLFVAKGVNYDDFTTGGITIAAATTTDNLKAVYWLADAATVLNTISCGLAIDSTQSDSSHYLWVLNADTTTTARIYKYDGRAALSGLSSGKSTSAFVFRTGQSSATTGIIGSSNGANGIMVTAGHGPGSGEKSLYWTTASRIYRTVESAITNGGTSLLTDFMTETPTGTANTFPASGALQTISYDSVIDRFFVFNNTATSRQYVTAYSTTDPMTHVFLFSTYQVDSSLISPSCPQIPSMISSPFYPFASDGIVYLNRIGGSSTNSGLYILPIAHWDYADGGGTASKQQRLITASIDTTGCQKFYRVYVNHLQFTASQTSSVKSVLPNPNKVPTVLENPHIKNSVLGLQNEPFRIYYRTSGISDDSGSWTAIADTGILTSVTPASAIQFMFEFKSIGTTCLMQRIFSLSVVFEDESTDSHYQPSVNKSDPANKIFAWRFSKGFGGIVPTLIVRIYDDVSGSLIAADTTTSGSYGTFERSTDGTSWSAYNTTDKTNETTYIRYTVSGTINGVKARAVLQQYTNQSTGSGTPAGSLTKDIVFGSSAIGDQMNLLLETDIGSAQPLNNILTSGGSNQDALVDDLHQLPVPISNRRKVR